jgi:dienelactone hydrolase
MDIVSETVEKAVVERRFDLKVGTEVVPGIHWLPEEPAPSHPTVLIGHGGTQHKRAPNVLALARALVRHLGVGAVALDAPEHGERVSDPEAASKARRGLEQRLGADSGSERRGVSESWRSVMAARIPGHVREWQALIDDLQTMPAWSAGPFGYWGLSMGTSHGLPLVAREPRIAAAVLGLNAVASADDPQASLAAKITVPVLFLLQSDDELMTRDAGIALWDALGSGQKTLHLNPGGHIDVPRFEREAAEQFFRRHLLA